MDNKIAEMIVIDDLPFHSCRRFRLSKIDGRSLTTVCAKAKKVLQRFGM